MIAQRLATVITNGGVDQAVMMKGNTNTMSTMYGTGIMANEWIPIIRAVVTAVAIGILPVSGHIYSNGSWRQSYRYDQWLFYLAYNMGGDGCDHPSDRYLVCV